MSPGRSASPGALAGVVVLDLSTSLAGALLTRLLADQGADCVRVDAADPTTDATIAHLRAGRAVRPAEALPGLLGEVDVVLDGDLGGVELPPGLVRCTLPGFGADDPRAGTPGWEGVVMAAAGAYSRGARGMFESEWWPPGDLAFSPLPLASVFAALQGALGVSAALVARQHDGLGQEVEVPLFDAFHEAIGARSLTYERNAPPGSLLASGLYRCSDGRYLTFVTVWYRHLEWFLDAAGHADWLAGDGSFEALMAEPRHQAALRSRLVGLFAERPAAVWEQLGREAGVPVAMLRSAEEWAAAGATDPVPPPSEVLARPAVRVVQVAERPHRPRAAGVPGEGPLAGVRVIDLTRVLAAPTVARLLGELGADVIRVDAASGPSGLRQPILHESANRGKRCTDLDLKSAAGRTRFEELCGDADVFVTNFTGAAVDGLGLGAEQLRALHPGLVHATVHCYDAHGPARDLRGFAEIANAVTGVTARTFTHDAPSGSSINVDLPRTPFTDYAAGVLGAYAVVLALHRRGATGAVSEVETTLVDAAALMQLPFLVDVVAGREPAPWHRLGWSPLHRGYRTADGHVFVGMTEPQARQLLGADPAEDDLAALYAALTTEEAVRRTLASGGGAHAVVAPEDLLVPGGPSDLVGLRLVRDSDTFGAVVQPGPAIALSRTPMRPGGLPVDAGPAGWWDRPEPDRPAEETA